MIKMIAHVCISAKNLDETERFYCSCLGLARKFSFIRDGEVYGYYLQVNENNFIEVFRSDAVSSEEMPLIRHFCLEVDNLDRAIEQIKRFGVDTSEKKLKCDNTWQIWTTDPNGIKVELQEYTPKSSQITGKDCIV